MKRCYNLQTCAENSSLERDIKICAETGFRAVEIDLLKAERYLEDHSMTEIGELLEQYGISCITINAVFDVSFCSSEKWETICGRLESACRLGQACKAESVIVLSSEREDLPKGVTAGEIFKDTVEVLKRMAETAGPYGMKIALEPVGTMAVGDIRTAWEIIKAADWPDIGLVIDDFNLFLWDLNSDMDCIREINLDRIFMVHINDAERIPFRLIDQMHRCMPGDGRIDVERYMGCLKAAGYDGYVSIEVLNPSIWEKGPEAVIAEAYEKISRFVDEEQDWEGTE